MKIRGVPVLLVFLLFVAACSTENSGEEKKCGDGLCDKAEQADTSLCPEDCDTEDFVSSSSADFSVDPVYEDSTYASSSQLQTTWKAVENADHYVIDYTDSITKEKEELSVSKEKISATLSDLKSGTSYSFDGIACLDSTCSTSEELGTAVGITEEEYWQIQGSGDGYDSATEIVEGGSVLSYALVHGDWSEEDDGGIVLYYKGVPPPGEEAGLSIAVSSSDAVEEGTPFVVQEDYGLRNPCVQGTPGTSNWHSCEGIDILNEVAATQEIPIASLQVIRLFFEAEGKDGKVRIMSLDSTDGYKGYDFNKGEDTLCSTKEDYEENCAPTLLIGVSGDEDIEDSGLENARQFKIGYPKQSSWLWDESIGTFMVLTGEDSCGQTKNGLFYAVWDGSSWNVEKDSSCAEALIQYGHGPVLVDISSTVYKLYYEDESSFTTDKSANKPLKLIYGNAKNSGDTTLVDFADWESGKNARDIHFLWPDGTEVSAPNEAGFGDHYIYMPTNDPKVQIMQLNLGGFDDQTWKKPSSGIGFAKFVNP